MLSKINQKWVFLISTFLFLGGIFVVLSTESRTDFFHYFIPYILSFIGYVWLTIFQNKVSNGQLLFLAFLAFSVSIIFPPYLSNDYFRFLWDGELFWNSINPYDLTPTELVRKGYLIDDPYMKQLYWGMSDLSRDNYSCYPPLNQIYFILSTSLTDSIFLNTLFLKISILATEIIGLIYLMKLLELLRVPSNKLFLLFLNPLFLIEGIGNAHFEGVMISFLIIAFYFLIQLKVVGFGFFMTLAIQIKLIPLLLLPFFYRFIGWKKASFSYLIIGVLLILFSSTWLNTENLNHFFKSLGLYFKLFQFNSSFLFAFVHLDPLHFYYHKISQYGYILSQISSVAILTLALLKKPESKLDFFSKLSIAYFIYLLFSSNVHPWYILPALFLSIMTNFTFLLLWSLTAFISYAFYLQMNTSTTALIVLLEYVPVLVLFVYEIVKGGLFQETKFAIRSNG